MKKLFWLALLLPLVAYGQQEAWIYNVVPTCSLPGLATCIGGKEPGRSAWVVNGSSPGDCSVGGGTFSHLCVQQSDGTFSIPGKVTGFIPDDGVVLWGVNTVNCNTVCAAAGYVCATAIDIDVTPAIIISTCATTADANPGFLCYCD